MPGRPERPERQERPEKQERPQKKQRGGKIKGQGLYGCVFQPSLLCRGQKTVEDGMKVGKITAPLEAKNELAIADYLRTVPDSLNYVVIPDPTSCIPAAISKQLDADLLSCELLESTPLNNTIQIQMPWGGHSLNRINMHPTNFNFFRFLEEMLAVGAFLVLNDISHLDVSVPNTLVDTDTRPRFIDFAFAFRPSQLTMSDLQFRWREISVDHDVEAPEVTLMQAAIHKIPPSEIIFELCKEKPAVKRLALLCDIIPSEWGADLKKWTIESNGFQQKDWLSCWKLYWPGFDAWAIGAVLLEILELQISVPEFTELPAWKQNSTKIHTLLKGLCNPNPVMRLDAVEALNLWTDGTHALVSEGSDGAEWVTLKARHRPV